jgi:hypothetical protein
LIINRIYSDYLMVSRLGEYKKLLIESLRLGYQHVSLIQYNDILNSGIFNKNVLYFIHRHDIDTDVRTAKKMFSIEKSLGIRSSYYFRLSTLDYCFMKEIDEYGSEASYHFEELSDYCKKYNIKSKEKALSNLDKIRLIFKRNIEVIEKESAIKIRSVAAHGDFVNRQLGVVNNVITDDFSLRNELGIDCEAYDSKLVDSFDLYISDKPHPIYFSPLSPFQALKSLNTKNTVICMTTHPRQWETNWVVNTKDNIFRAIEGARW